MPLPKKTIRVFPNPWGFIHHETGPQGHCHEDTGGRGSTPRYIGAELCPNKTVKVTNFDETDPNETRLNEWKIHFRFPSLDAKLTGPSDEFKDGIELPKTPYYLDRLRDGDLIPADVRSGEHGARFASLAEARAAGIAAFEAHYGEGSFAEVSAELADAVTAPGTPSAKATRVSKAPDAAPAATPPAAPAQTPAPSTDKGVQS